MKLAKDSGFSIIEIAVSLGVFAIVLGTISSFFYYFTQVQFQANLKDQFVLGCLNLQNNLATPIYCGTKIVIEKNEATVAASLKLPVSVTDPGIQKTGIRLELSGIQLAGADQRGYGNVYVGTLIAYPPEQNRQPQVIGLLNLRFLPGPKTLDACVLGSYTVAFP